MPDTIIDRHSRWLIFYTHRHCVPLKQGIKPYRQLAMPKKYFRLNISASEYQTYYRGTAQVVVARTTDGLQIQFPASRLRDFVSHSGIHGHFEITYNADRKLVGIRKLDQTTTR